MRKTYKIADHVFDIDSVNEGIHKMCADYLSDEKPTFEITTVQADIDFERAKSDSERIKEGGEPINFSDSYLETLAVYRKLADILVEDNIILFHGSVIAVDGEAFLFTAKSGTGKSTHTALWRKKFGERAFMVNDDKPLIRITEDKAIVYGTPWDGKHHLSKNTSVELKAVCILERSENNVINKITRSDAYTMLVQQTHKTKNRQKLIRTLQLIDALAANTDLYRLGCNMDMEAAEVAYNAMKG